MRILEIIGPTVNVLSSKQEKVPARRILLGVLQANMSIK